MKALTVPPAALADPNATEMFRGWIAERGLHCSLRIGMYASGKPVGETDAWGVILADAIQQIADVLASDGQGDRGVLAGQIFERLERELENAPSRRNGEFVITN